MRRCTGTKKKRALQGQGHPHEGHARGHDAADRPERGRVQPRLALPPGPAVRTGVGPAVRPAGERRAEEGADEPGDDRELRLPARATATAGSSAPGEIATIKQGQSLTFVNDDQPANIRHTVTTCAWPCNGPYVGNYPLADGRWDSTTLGYDVIDQGNPNPVAQTPQDLPTGQVRVLLPDPPVDARGVRGRVATRVTRKNWRARALGFGDIAGCAVTVGGQRANRRHRRSRERADGGWG